jgi:hypothetical protein
VSCVCWFVGEFVNKKLITADIQQPMLDPLWVAATSIMGPLHGRYE